MELTLDEQNAVEAIRTQHPDVKLSRRDDGVLVAHDDDAVVWTIVDGVATPA